MQAPDPNVSVIALDIDGTARANQDLTQQPDGSVTLNGQFAELRGDSKVKINNRGVTLGWTHPSTTLAWNFDLYRPGTYRVTARTAAVKINSVMDDSTWTSGDELKIAIQGHQIVHEIRNEGKVSDPRNPLFPDVKTDLGEVSLQPGKVRLTLSATKISPSEKNGIHLREIVLTLVQ